ncbi:hypothetical protein IW140_002007 [Coemansia sp. RSA 1813]|nr:hypothetical protein EV178_000381 [Coemansia sp. RSA 1646]KAJ1773511.1 hypothetical protein LPJ74_000425 [Coemansia sp. RSA 1843]KAJ2085517.1 hypothetical protein IW138_006284 [Coemansia sp. RSA 986]KAJ2216394.1 hypothetical protein EV179_001421 [Coemansia sp. RSA 487]KAJ2570820.1 hypothetical protein IW140_002007 [Coemansia sp. RSA 1813]
MVSSELATAVDKRLKTITTQANQIRDIVEKLRERVEDGELATGSGISFLEVKHHTMLSYITHLAYLTLLKLHGKQIEDHPAIMNLIEDRTVLERMRPLEQRLKYQIDKMLRNTIISTDEEAQQRQRRQEGTEQLATTDDPEKATIADTSAKLAAVMLGEDTLADPTAFKPNPGSLATDIREEDEMAIESGLYRAPRQMPVHYEEDGNSAAKKEKEEQRMMQRAARSRLVRDLMTEYDDRPEMTTASGNPSVGLVDGKLERLAEDRARYEEENFKRISVGKKERKGLRSKFMELEDEFGHLNDFAGLAGLQKSTVTSNGKTEILDRLKKKRDNESMADKVNRRRKGGNRDSDDEVFGFHSMHSSKKGKFDVAKKHVKKRR